jgi:hypothetical protein
MADHMDCSICLDAVDAKTTGRVEMTCAHVFHFKCLASWFSKQGKSSCPLCRQNPKELEDLTYKDVSPSAPSPSRQLGERPRAHGDGAIYISRLVIDSVIRSRGGFGVNAAVEATLGFDEFDHTVIRRSTFERILQEQGCPLFSSFPNWNLHEHGLRGYEVASWNEMMFMYPVRDPVSAGLARDPVGPADSPLYISRSVMDGMIRGRRGRGLDADVEAEVGFDEHGKATMTRSELERIVCKQGGWPFSDPDWNHLTFIYRR